MIKVSIQSHICLRHFSAINSLKFSIFRSSLCIPIHSEIGGFRVDCSRLLSDNHGPLKFSKALIIEKFGKPDVFSLVNVMRPVPVKGEVLIRIESAGINPVDTYIREGAYKVLPQLPAILGKEVAGTIEDIDKSADNSHYNFKVGDRVFARLIDNGGYSEYIATNIENVHPLPDNLTFSEGACLYVTYYTAYRALVIKSKIDTNETLLIHGATGGVGTAALQIAKSIGIKSITATAGTDEGLKMLKELGAHYVFNHKKKGHMDEAKAAIGDKGFDVILENAADVNLGDDCNMLAPGGTIAIVGCRGPAEITPRSLMITEGLMLGVNLGLFTKEELNDCTEFILEGVHEGKIKPVIDREYSLEEAAQAHVDIIHKGISRGKLVFKMAHEEIKP